MTIAKQRGGSQVLFFQPGMTDSMHERLAQENDLRRALAAGEFQLNYQPEISIKTGRIIAAEALLRRRHPTEGIIGPNSFISFADALEIELTESALMTNPEESAGVLKLRKMLVDRTATRSSLAAALAALVARGADT